MGACVLRVCPANIRLESLVAPHPAIYTVPQVQALLTPLQQVCLFKPILASYGVNVPLKVSGSNTRGRIPRLG